MKAVVDILEERITVAMASVAGGEACAAIVKPSRDAKFGDYQANGIMGLAKKLIEVHARGVDSPAQTLCLANRDIRCDHLATTVTTTGRRRILDVADFLIRRAIARL